MPSIDLAALPTTVVRPLIVAIAHIPIMLLALCIAPILLFVAVRPESHGDLAVRLLCELRTWSRDAVGAASGRRTR